MAEVITARLDKQINTGLDLVSKTEHLDRSTVIRRLLSRALEEWKEKRALELYKEGKFSAEQASNFAKVSLWAFFEALRRNNVSLNYDLQEIEEDIKTIRSL